MAFFQWLNFYSVGNETIDNQHKKLIELVNESYDAFSKSKSDDVVKKIIFELIDYTIYHFKFEEDLFKKYSFPGAEEHITEHQNFIKQVSDFKRKIDTETKVFNVEIFTFLKNWVHNHIVKTDKKYAKFFKNVKAEEFM